MRTKFIIYLTEEAKEDYVTVKLKCFSSPFDYNIGGKWDEVKLDEKKMFLHT